MVSVRYSKPAWENKQRRDRILVGLEDGRTIISVLAELNKSQTWYNNMRAQFPEWSDQVDKLRTMQRSRTSSIDRHERAGTFDHFCDKYLGRKLFYHQLQWVDLLEGRPPRDLHPSMTFEQGDTRYIMVNTPPEHAKTQSLSIAYPLYRICKDPNERILLISKTEKQAKKHLYLIKQFMTHPRYRELQLDFAPVGGWKDTSDMWATDMIYLNALDRDATEKDPTVQAKGIGQQVYGDRATLAVLDDCVVLANAHQWEDQSLWVQQEVSTRLGDAGQLLIVGTRVDTSDLYKELRNPEMYPTGTSPWTYLAQPAVLDYSDKPADWVTLWPRSDHPWANVVDSPDENNLYRRWDGPTMARRRSTLQTRVWSLSWMQMSVEEDAIFPAELVRRSVNGNRSPGTIKPGMPGVRAKGMDGLFVVAGLDPAMVGDTAITVIGLDRHTGVRHVLECQVKTAASPTWIRDTVKDVTTRIGVHEWRVEKNAFQIFLTQDPELKSYLANLGVTLTEHFTGRNKIDVGYGVASMSVLFHNNLIELPAMHKSEAIRQLVDQFTVWTPETKAKQDLVMSCWFAELKCREIMMVQASRKGNPNYMANRFATRRQRSMQHSINLSDFAGLSGGE